MKKLKLLAVLIAYPVDKSELLLKAFHKHRGLVFFTLFGDVKWFNTGNRFCLRKVYNNNNTCNCC